MKDRKAFIGAPIAIATALLISACGGATDEDMPGVRVEGGETSQSQPSENTESDDTSTDEKDDARDDSEATYDDTRDDSNDASVSNSYNAIVEAVKKAESETGGKAVEVDLEDGEYWEIETAQKDREIDVKVSLDGASVISIEDDDEDDDDFSKVSKAKIDIFKAIETAESDRDSEIDSIELDEDDGRIYWEIEFRDDSEMKIDYNDGAIILDN